MSPWPVCALSDVAQVGSGAGFPIVDQGKRDEIFPFLKVSDMNLPGNERRILRWNNSVSEGVRSRLRATAFPAGSIIFPKIGAAIATNKKRVLTRPSCVDNNVMALVPNSAYLDSDYLYYALIAKNISDFASDSNPPSIRKPTVEAWRISLPPLAEQRRIVDLLSRAEGILRLRRGAQAKAQTIVPALFLDLFGDPAMNPKGWPVCLLSELLRNGPTNGLYKHQSAYGSGTPILRIDGFYDGKVSDLTQLKRVALDSEVERNRFALAPGDIVINRVNSPEYLGKSAIIPALDEPTVYESNMMRFAVDGQRVLPEFVIALLQQPAARRHFLAHAKHAINQSSINQQDVKSLPVIVPPLALQAQFAERVAAMQAIATQQTAALHKAQATFNALLARTFSAAGIE